MKPKWLAADDLARRHRLRKWTGPFLTPRQGSVVLSERRYLARVRREEELPPMFRVDCNDCKAQRRPCERGALVLNGERWLCDPCADDNRAAVQGEARAARRL